MQMVRLNIIKRHNPAGTNPVEKMDLDEKIRRIREANKERERRFQEIEQDKKLALDPELMKKESCKDNTSKDRKKELQKTMKGVQSVAVKRAAKGRGQRLVEMSKHNLKAEHFESRTKDQWEILDEYILPEKITLKNNCRSSIRERIKTKTKDSVATASVVGNENAQDSVDVSKAEDKLDCIPDRQQNEIPKDELQENKGSSETSQECNDTQLLDDIQEETKAENHREGSIAPCESNQQTNNETVLDDVEQQVTDIKETSTSNKQLDEKPTTQKNNKPKFTLKKTVSSSSFEESMAMLSPLDCPQNWGDSDFNDTELPAVSIWTNP